MSFSIPEFYKGKKVLITGCTGFVGKALIEKLLRSCPDIDTLYLMIRPKKGVSSEERLEQLCNMRVFDLLKEKNPAGFKKIKLINGNITEDGMGITEDDRLELQNNCNIIFHSAACVRFDLKLKDAVNMNTSGTLRVLTLAESMENLEAFVHLSTSYCRCDLDILKEMVYPGVHKPRRIMDIVKWMDDETLAYLEPKLISSEPNTYSYTKAITEDLVDEYSGKFPIAIARLSIVTAAWKEPIPGWIDNINGPTGILIGSGKGVIRSMHCESSYTADAVPVDTVVNACILIGCLTALDKLEVTTVYNLTLSGAIRITWGDILALGEKFVHQFPYSVALWYPGGSIKSYRITHHIYAFFLHTLPAYFFDALLFIFGRKTFMVNLHQRIQCGLTLLQYYTTKEWQFRNKNYVGLRSRISKEDNDVFYTDIGMIDPDDYLKNYVLGTRQFVCNEDPANLPRARRLHKIRYIADRLVKIIFYGLLLWFLYSYSQIFTSYVEYLDCTMKRIAHIDQVKADMCDV